MGYLKFIALLCIAASVMNPALASMIYVPPNLKESTAKMVVVIHGCLQSAESMAFGTGWNQVAEANNLVILYPQVPLGSNPLDCWSWYLPENQRADSGQLKVIVNEIISARKKLKLKEPQIYVTGISSGAATASGLLACFPGMFRAGAIHSGPSYALAQTLKDADIVLREGPGTTATSAPCRPRDFHGSILVIQGNVDAVVNPRHALKVIVDFVGNSSAISIREVRDSKNSYTVSDYSSSNTTNGRLVMVDKLDHAWSGFAENLRHPSLLGPQGKIPTTIPFFSEVGPSATDLIWKFFLETSRRPASAAARNRASKK